VKPTFRTKCPSLRLSAAPPAQCTMTTTTQKKNTMMPGMAYPAIALVLAAAVSYPSAQILFDAEACRSRAKRVDRVR
jgi:hypothetical protein